MALVIVAVMTMMYAVPMTAFAETPTDGSITVNSPIVGTTYTAYKVFDMTTNADVNAFSYTISSDSPFYAAVNAYAAMPAQLPDSDTDGLTLTVTADTANATEKVYNVSFTDDFDPQAFGQALQAAIKTNATAFASTAETPIAVTEDNSQSIKFDNLDLGYFLITSEYPKADFSTVTMTVKDYAGVASTNEADKYVFNKTSLADPEAATLTLTSDAKNKIAEYVNKTVTYAYVRAYINDKNLKDKDSAGNEIAIADASGRWTEVKNEIIKSMKEDAEKKILAALKNQLEGSESDINLAKEPILVFLDSSQPEATINEKNEIDKWDTPVNPSGDALPKDLPDYGEPEGGKNIVIKEATDTTPAVYADWTEASIGDSIHYQLRVNAMNFVRESDDSDEAIQATADKVKQVKEYFLADYQNEHMTFDASKFLRVKVIDGNGTNVTRNADGNSVEYLDYTNVANNKFFKNGVTGSSTTDVLGNSGGIMVPWVIVSKDDLSSTYPVYTTTKVPTGQYLRPEGEEKDNYVLDSDGYALDEDNARIPLYDTYYVYSLYKSDVTIVVDYYMTLNDDAVIDGDGNPNYAQYGYSPVDNKDGDGKPKQPTTPNDEDKPSEKKDVDNATIYTYALAFVKVNNKAEALGDATFELPFYVKKNKANDGSYVYAFDELGENDAYPTGYTESNSTNTLTTPANGVITIKGITQGVYSFTETVAPEGYNKLPEPFEVEAKKTGAETIIETAHTIYLDAQGNVTDEETTTTVTTHTSDSNLPVYELLPVVNQKGTELPSTGGIGTTIFYVVGALLVLGAGVLLVTRRRARANEQ